MDPTTIERNYSGDWRMDDATLVAEAEVRDLARELAMLINERLPQSREKSTALIKLEEALFWAAAGLHRVGPRDEVSS